MTTPSDLDLAPLGGERPADPLGDPGLGELALDLLARLAEVLPALEVQRHQGAQLQLAGEAHGFRCVQRVAGRAAEGETHAAQVEDPGADVEALAPLGDPLEVDGVAAPPESAVLLARPLE